MKSDATANLDQLSSPAEKRPLNPWLLVIGTGLAFLAVVIVGLLLLAWIAPKSGLRSNEVLMSDGKVLRIEAVTWGRNHRLDFEYSSSDPWEFWNHRRMPITHGVGQDQLMVWMSCHDARSGRPLDFDWWSGSFVVDSLGEEIPDRDPQHRQMGRRGSSFSGGSRPFRAERSHYDTWLVSSSFPAFRTDQGRFKLNVKNLASEVVASIELTHPSPPVAQSWQAEESPTTKTNGDVSVTLQCLRANSHWGTNNGLRRQWWHYYPEAKVSKQGQPATDQFVNLLEITDSLGNHQYGGEPLSLREPAWKVRVGAFQSQTSEFSAAETWTLLDLPLVEKDKATTRSDARTIGGVTVTLVAMAGPGKTSYSIASAGLSRYGNFSSSSGSSAFGSPAKLECKRNGSIATSTVEANWPHLTLETSGLTPLHRMYLKAKDDQGREVQTQQSHHYAELQSFFFKTEPDAKSLTLSIIVHKGLEFEFFVKPPDLSDEKPMP